MKALVFGAAIAIVTAGVAWGSFGMEGELAANLKERLTTSTDRLSGKRCRHMATGEALTEVRDVAGKT